MSLNIKFSYLAENSKFSRSNSYFSIFTPTFLRDGFLNSWFQNPSENSEDGHYGGHLGYQNGTILAILNLHVATMPPTKFQLNPTNGSGRDVENVKS